MKKILLLFAVLFLSLQVSLAQKVTVTGTVTSKEDGLPIIGASVLEKGTTNGTITNYNGVYTISVPIGATLVFSYVGMDKVERKVTGEGKIDVIMNPTAIAIDEVIVTAMGVKAEKKKLNFAVQSVDAEAITDGRSPNFVNSLQGKISGVSVTSSGGSPNAGSQILLRGISSINPSQNNEPLFILDGMVLSGGGSAAADINPSDIENVTVLKGAAASALYGQNAANGAIMITTKTAKAGKMSLSANASIQSDTPTRLLELQSIYGPGALGFYRPQESGGYGGWGPLLDKDEPVYNNVKNYFQSGLYQKYDFSINGGSDKFQSYASVNYSRHDGIVPKDYLDKMGLLLKGNYEINNKISANFMTNIVKNSYRGAGSISAIYSWPINDDITHYKNSDGSIRYRYISIPKKENSPISPLWSRYMDYGLNSSTRNLLQGSLIYKPLKGLEITGRLSLDQNNYMYDGYQVPRFDDSIILDNPPKESDYTNLDAYAQALKEYNDYYYSVPYFNEKDYASVDKDFFGNYSYSQSKRELVTATLMGNYKIPLPKDFNLEVLAGTEIKTDNRISSSINGRDFVIPGTYSISNVREIVGTNDVSLNHWEKRNAGVFGELRSDYKGLLNLSVTSRWDWSSTIAYKYNPYFYPSVTGGIIFSEIFGLSNDWFSYGKLRGNWARVGKDVATPYLFDRKYTQYPTLPDGGYGADPTMSVASNLQPEISDSWEIGLETRFFSSKTRLDVAYYSTTVDNQIVTVRVSPASGYILQTRNEGNIKNHGVEISLDQDILKNKDLLWTGTLNFGFNRGKVLSLPEDIVELQGTQYGDIFPTAYLNGSTTAISGKDYLRNEKGEIICTPDGYPKINPTKSVLIGNREPDFLMGLTSTLKYKGISLSFLVDGRKGGDVMNVTGRSLWSSGQHKMLEFYRGRQVVWDGVVEQADGTYVRNTTPIVLDNQTIINYYYNVSSNFIEDGSYIRLSYVTLGYDFTNKLKNNRYIHGLRCSLTGTNLFLLTKYSGSDPQINASTSEGGTGSMGIDNYPVPNTRGINFTINANF
ncbi:MAG TPA: SusC/RagA family TonB-linked outer membrane protein [Paludibacteraceae bacterium]|nr:SusC/RagA family TonB-linked outer membrane protein [Paludibacteraceae bacterium]